MFTINLTAPSLHDTSFNVSPKGTAVVPPKISPLAFLNDHAPLSKNNSPIVISCFWDVKFTLDFVTTFLDILSTRVIVVGDVPLNATMLITIRVADAGKFGKSIVNHSPSLYIPAVSV